MKRLNIILSSLLLSAFAGGGIMAASVQGEETIATQKAAATASLKVYPGQVELTVNSDEPETFVIYSITGQLVKTVTVAAASETIEIPQGCYIVKCSKWSKKIVVR